MPSRPDRQSRHEDRLLCESRHHFLDYGLGELGGALFGTAEGAFAGLAEFHVNRSDTRFAANSLARLV